MSHTAGKRYPKKCPKPEKRYLPRSCKTPWKTIGGCLIWNEYSWHTIIHIILTPPHAEVMGMHFKLGLYEHQSAGALEGLITALVNNPELVSGGSAVSCQILPETIEIDMKTIDSCPSTRWYEVGVCIVAHGRGCGRHRRDQHHRLRACLWNYWWSSEKGPKDQTAGGIVTGQLYSS